MNKLDTHPTVLKVQALPLPTVVNSIDAETLRKISLECGADDVGFVNLNRTEMDSERADILRLFPQTRSVICIVCRMNPDAIRSPSRNLANHEFHGTGDHVNEVARKIVAELAARGVRAVNPPMAFPME